MCPKQKINKKSKNKSAAVIKSYMSEFCLEDVWRVRNEGVKRYSWYRQGGKVASRIDLLLASQGLSSNIGTIFYRNGILSDHSALHFVIECHENLRGGGFWKMNAKVLQSKEYLEKIN